MCMYNGKYYEGEDILKVIGTMGKPAGNFESTKVIVEEKMPEMPEMYEMPLVTIPSKTPAVAIEKIPVKEA